MLVSALLAWMLPFEMFLLAYAVLGPLHYLTQISWLHDRGWFTTGRFDWIPLAALAAVAYLVTYTSWVSWSGTGFAALGAGLVAAFVPSLAVKVASVAGFVLLAIPVLSWDLTDLVFAQLLTTVIHVYLFTGLFILAGSMKSRSQSGYLSLGVFLACGLGLLLFHPSAASYQVGPYTRSNVLAVGNLFDATARLLPGGTGGWNGWVAVARFLAFAYTYH